MAEQLKQLFSNDKADELISALGRIKTGGGENNLSNATKLALMNCFSNLVWSTKNGQDYYDALYYALFGTDRYWDFEWDASFGTLPPGMVADDYSFSKEAGALYATKPQFLLNYIGNVRLCIDCKIFSVNEYGDLTNNNNPQIVITNKQYGDNFKGIKIIACSSLNSDLSTHYVAVGINGRNSLINGYNSADYHKYDITAINGEYALKIDDNDITIANNDDMNPYFGSTGIISAPDIIKPQILYLKSIKYKIMEDA